MAILIARPWLLVVGFGISVYVYVLYTSSRRRKQRSLPLPPGPRKLPLIGNLLDVPATRPWEAHMQWSKQFDSDIIHLDVAGQSIVVLCSAEAARDLLEKRSALYSDRWAAFQIKFLLLQASNARGRARLPMLVELMGFDYNVAMMKYGDEWRTNRRLMNQDFGTPAKSRAFRPAQRETVHALLRRLLKLQDRADARGNSDFEDWIGCFRKWTAELTVKTTYGIDLPADDEDDAYVRLAEESVRVLSDAGVPGKYLVDAFPVLKYLPSWMPGMQFKRDAKRWRVPARGVADYTFEETKLQMAAGTAPPSFVANKLSTLSTLPPGKTAFFTPNTVRCAAGTIFLGGTDSTVSAVSTFVLAMLANPAAQREAQKEIDSIAKGRLPNWEDYDEQRMPYVAALVREVLRWRNVGPMAIPHYVAVEDEYRGYRIPANSIVIGSTWSILHDEKTYPDPFAFKPERYLKPKTNPNDAWELDPGMEEPEVAFGFGRRLCPGRHMARASLFLAIASVLATFDIRKEVSENGKEVEPSYEYSSGFISSPLPFNCRITPRSEGASTVNLVRATQGE